MDRMEEMAGERDKAIESFRAQHEESAFGTTAEIAEKLNISKKKVRKMKQDGTLDQVMAEHTMGALQ